MFTNKKDYAIISLYLKWYNTIPLYNEANIVLINIKRKVGLGDMKFSPKKKAKMRKAREKRMSKEFKDMFHYVIPGTKYYVIDQIKINGTIYLLVENLEGKNAIYKIADMLKFVKLSPKRLIQLRNEFIKQEKWKRYSYVTISDNGKVVAQQTINLEFGTSENEIWFMLLLKNE